MTSNATNLQPPRRRRGLLILGAVLGTGLVAAGAVSAHWDRGWRDGGWHRGGERGERFARFCGSDTARYAPVIRAYVKADLRLDQSQSEQFNRIADLVLPGLDELKSQVCNDFATRGGPAPERLQALAANLRKAADLAERAVDPSRQFYTGLNDDQKRRVDDLTSRRFGPPR